MNGSLSLLAQHTMNTAGTDLSLVGRACDHTPLIGLIRNELYRDDSSDADGILYKWDVPSAMPSGNYMVDFFGSMWMGTPLIISMIDTGLSR